MTPYTPFVEVRRGHLREVRIVDRPRGALRVGEARLRIESFALTANNVTYAAMGEAMKYWQFFPTGDEMWGRVPVWGFGEVVESQSDAALMGERVYGYFPMGAELVVTPGRADVTGFTDLAHHRQSMSPVYNRYQRVADQPHDLDDALQMVLYPLFVTGFLIADALADDPAGAPGRVIVSSASSKTALALGWCLRSLGIATVGLTSATRRQAVNGMALWSEVVDYDHVGQVTPGSMSSAYVDIAGQAEVTRQVQSALGDSLTRSLIVGITHWDQLAEAGAEPPGVARELFFAPARIAKRQADWGRGGLDQRMSQAWDEFTNWARGWLDIRRVHGPEAVAMLWRELVDGVDDPRRAFVASLADS
jgi:hypothetical protein